MALQAGVQTSKVLILLGAGLSGSIILKSGRLSELIAQLQELLRGVEGDEISPYNYDSGLLAEQIRQLAKEIKELSLSGPVTIFNGNSESSGSYASYLMPAAAVGAMGYCYMWWKGWSFSDVMFVTKSNMTTAVSTVSKQLENLSDTLAATKRHLSKRLETLDWKVEEHHERSKLLLNDVNEMKSSLSQIGFDVETIHEIISGLEGKIELLESKQDVTNSGLWYLCNVAGGFKQGTNTKDIGAKLAIGLAAQENSPKGLQFLADGKESAESDKTSKNRDEGGLDGVSAEKAPVKRTRIHRSYPVGISWARGVIGSGS